MKGSKILIIGGNGFIGKALTKHFLSSLSQYDGKVYAMDLHSVTKLNSLPLEGSTFGVGSRFVYLVGDIANLDSLREVFDHSTPDLVISLAGYGMSGSAMLDSYMCNLVNYEGTKNIIQVCREKNVQRLIYTSTYNVVYGGDPIENGTEALDYYPIDNHTDAYSATKAKAEIEILNANGTITASGDILVTSVIRPAAIYGPDEERHLPRIVKIMDLGLFAFRIGDPIVDWVHIDNLTQAYDKLAKKMLNVRIKKINSVLPVPCGQVYCISDGDPIEMFEFFRPIAQARGVRFPSLIVPKSLMIKIAYICEYVHRLSLVGKLFGLPAVPPFITRAEVFKSGETHYFKITKAKKELLYNPTISSVEGSIELGKIYRNNLNNDYFFQVPDWTWWILVISGMTLLTLIAFQKYTYVEMAADTTAVKFPAILRSVLKYPDLLVRKPLLIWNVLYVLIRYVTTLVRYISVYVISKIEVFSFFIFRSKHILQLVWWAAIMTHIAETIYTINVAVSIGVKYTLPAWILQTVLLGGPSMNLILARREFMETKKKHKLLLQSNSQKTE